MIGSYGVLIVWVNMVHSSISRVDRKTGVSQMVFPKPNLLTMKVL